MVRTIGAFLRFVFWLNSLAGVLCCLGFIGTFPFAGTMMESLRAHHSASDAQAIVASVRMELAVGAFAVVAAGVILSRLVLMVRSVEAGDPFIEANADRLQAIAWALLIFQLLNIGLQYVDWNLGRIDGGSGFSFSLTGWIAVLVAFVLARVFAVGARMRADLLGTV